ncbi:serine kinase [Verminephrobacter eiseniae]|uniref:phosphotransferase enzyme family protein n=1 Tax=Verminephrobacter eiseniae TaxID=364317 RepID=UPI002238C6FD|nr:phosphotransferase [Verminephrobacter eiseniae]MCW5261660.1 serine kinase [Verminephrobacter eiseniae]
MTAYINQEAAAKLDEVFPLAELALKAYGPEFQGELSLLTHSENSTYLVNAFSGQRFVMRVHRAHYHSRTAIESELAWLDALADEGMEVPKAIAGRDGAKVQTIGDGHAEKREVVLFHWINGYQPDQSQQESLIQGFRRLGEITAGLHIHARQWQRPHWFERRLWSHDTMVGAHAAWGNWQKAPYLDKPGAAIIGKALDKVRMELNEYGNAADLFGLIHADLRLTNLLVEEEITRIIDFDDCGFSWFMHDLAAAVSFIEHSPCLNEWVGSWVNGYSTVLQLSAADHAVIPALITQRRVQLLAWTGTHQGAPQADGLGNIWVVQTIELCEKYLANTLLDCKSIS